MKYKKKEKVIESKKVIKPSDFHIKLNLADKIYEATGTTLYEAVSNIPLDWLQVKTKGTVTVTKDGKSYEHYFYLRQMRRMFANHLMRHAFVKNLEFLFNAKAK